MAFNSDILNREIDLEFETVSRPMSDKVIEFYEEAGMDYEHWSSGFNMHLGYYRPWSNPFDRETMLEQANLEIARRLRLEGSGQAFLIDLGCGAGAIARTIARKYPHSTIKGVTVAPSQVKLAAKLNTLHGLTERIEVLGSDYRSLPFDDAAADGVWAVESACYDKGAGKEDLVREMARVLKPGGRFVIADCFIKRPEKDLSVVMKRCYSTVCEGWALPEMPEIKSLAATLGRHDFVDIIVEDISWHVAPSLAHAPFAVAAFIFKKLMAGERLKRHSINNLKASLLALALGLNRTKFSYCIVSGQRGGC